jgi:hypothetical protein
LGDRAFNRPQTKPELVTKLMGTAYAERSFSQSVRSLVRGDSPTDPALGEKEKRRVGVPQRDGTVDPGAIRYGFGIYVGRDGLEHLGIDRVHRRERPTGLVIWEEQQKAKKSRRSKKSKHDRKDRNNSETENMV